MVNARAAARLTAVAVGAPARLFERLGEADKPHRAEILRRRDIGLRQKRARILERETQCQRQHTYGVEGLRACFHQMHMLGKDLL